MQVVRVEISRIYLNEIRPLKELRGHLDGDKQRISSRDKMTPVFRPHPTVSKIDRHVECKDEFRNYEARFE